MVLTYGNNNKLKDHIGYVPRTNLYDGLKNMLCGLKIIINEKNIYNC